MFWRKLIFVFGLFQLLAALSVSIGAMTVGFNQAYTSTAIVSMNDANSTNYLPVSEEQVSKIFLGILFKKQPNRYPISSRKVQEN